MLKTSDAYTILHQVPDTIRALTKRASGLEEENARLREKVASFELRDRAVKVAEEMSQKGLNDHLSMEEKVSMLLEEPEKLSVREEATKLAAQQVQMAELADDHEGGGRNQLEAYILGDDN